MAAFYFFADTNPLSPPLAANAFGPAGTGAGNDRYRVSGLHGAASDPNAYAVCDGIVCAQDIPGTSPALVNLILKPLTRPSINFVPVRYYIYKGIRKDSLFAGAAIAAAPTNQLTQSMWASQNAANQSANTPGVPAPAAALGIDLTAANTSFGDGQPIDNLFYRTGVTSQFPVVRGGWSIGTFDKTRFGFEILLEGLGFHHTLALTRSLEDYILVPTLPATPTTAQRFDHWHAKEQALGYMDPCAFYGSFFRNGIQAKSDGSSSFAAKSGNALYNDVLSAFSNKNTAYLDIRNEFNFSFNYFGNYGATVRLSNHPTPVDYYASGWPILTLTASTFAAANTTDPRNAFRIQLPVGDNPQPLLYVSQGYRNINSKATGFPAELKSAERFYDAFLAPVGGYTATKNTAGVNSTSFVVPNVTGLGSTTPVACYIRLKYLKQQQGATTVPTVIKSANYLDNLVCPIELRIPFSGTASIKTSVYDEELYVNARQVPGIGCDFVGRVGIARDAVNTSFFLMPTVVRTKPGQASSLVTLSGETSDYAGSFPAFVALKYPLERVRASKLVLSTTVQAPMAEFVSDGNAAARAAFKVPDFSKFVVIVVANGAYDFWKNTVAATLDANFRIYLGVKNLQVQTDGVGVKYTSFELVLRGFVPDSTTGGYKLQEMTTDPVTSGINVKGYARAGA